MTVDPKFIVVLFLFTFNCSWAILQAVIVNILTTTRLSLRDAVEPQITDSMRGCELLQIVRAFWVLTWGWLTGWSGG